STAWPTAFPSAAASGTGVCESVAMVSVLLFGYVEVGDGAAEHLGRHGQRFRQRRVRVDRETHVFGVAAQLDRERRLGDQIARRRADDAGADDALVARIEEQLREAFAAAEAQRPAARGPWKHRLLDGDAAC